MSNDNRPDGVSDMLGLSALDLCGGDPSKAAGALLGTAKALLMSVTGSEETAILALAKVLKDELEAARRARRSRQN